MACPATNPNQLKGSLKPPDVHIELLTRRIARLTEENEELRRDKRSFRDASDQSRRDLAQAQEVILDSSARHRQEVEALQTMIQAGREESECMKRKVAELEAVIASSNRGKRRHVDETDDRLSRKRRLLPRPTDDAPPVSNVAQHTSSSISSSDPAVTAVSEPSACACHTFHQAAGGVINGSSLSPLSTSLSPSHQPAVNPLRVVPEHVVPEIGKGLGENAWKHVLRDWEHADPQRNHTVPLRD